MTRNQLLPKYVKNFSGDVMFTVDGSGNISPTAQQTINRGQTILTHADPACTTPFSGHVCARQNDVCVCSTLIANLNGAQHMALSTSYTISSGATVGSDYMLYAVPDSGPTQGAEGDIHIGS
jgi:hypothetical protein